MTPERVIWEASSLPYLVQERQKCQEVYTEEDESGGRKRRWREIFGPEWTTVARFEMQGSAENDAIARAKVGAYTRVVRDDGLSADYS